MDGFDELGVVLVTAAGDGQWFGSTLSLEQARRLAPFNNATTLQVAAGIAAALQWRVRPVWGN